MSRNVFFVVSLLVLVAVGVFWYQYRWYRTPVLLETATTPLIVVGTPNQDDIPVIDEPVFESVAAADVYLNDAGYGLLVEVGRRARFYPFQVLVWHLAVNDTLAGRDLLVTYDPLVGSALAYERGNEETFGVSGKLWNSNALLYDRATGSLWSQMLGSAIDGPRTDETLSRYPSRIVAWSTLKSDFAQADVLSRQTGFDRDYTQDPYEGYDATPAIWFPLSSEDARLPAKTRVYGVERDGAFVAYAVDSFEEFDRIRALVGEDTILVPAYWFAWAAMHPQTEIDSSP